VKGLLWFDLVVKATSRVAPITTLANRVTCDVTAQNLGFWHYLDTKFGTDAGFYADKGELWVAEQYVRHHAEGFVAPPAVLEGLRRRVEDEFWVHPASRRILELWSEQAGILGLDEQIFHTWAPLPLGVEDALAALESMDLLLDAREMGGGAYLDLTPEGVPLRQIVNEHGVPNYVLHVLRELLAVGPAHDRVLFGFDSELRPDFDLIARVMQRAGVSTIALPLERVRLPGVSGTTRTGGWEEYTLARVIDRFVPVYGVPVFRLGLRMYYVLHIGRRGGCEFDLDVVDKFMRKAAGAARRLDGSEPDLAAAEALLRELWPEISTEDTLYADPNRLVQALFKRAPESGGARTLVGELLLQ
jgi:hypothetical protein